VTYTDADAVILPFEEAPAIIGSVGGGISNDDLLNYGLIDSWTTESTSRVRQLGTTTNTGTQYPVFKPINEFTYTFSDSAEFNQVIITVKTDDVPTLLCGGHRCTYKSHKIVDDYFEITYTVPKMLNLSTIAFVIIGATGVAGGVQKNIQEEVNIDYYPIIVLEKCETVPHVGIQAQVYQLIACDANGKFSEFVREEYTMRLVDELINYSGAEHNVVLNKASLTLDSDPVLIGLTVYVFNPDSMALTYMSEIMRLYRMTGNNMKQIRIR
jgi:hypothetical protein